MGSKGNQSAGGDWTSVVFSQERVDVAEVRRRRDRPPELRAWESFSAQGTEAEALGRLRRRLGRSRCTTLLGHNQYRLLQVEPPEVPKEELRDALRWRVKEMLDFPVDQAGIDVLDIPTAMAGPGRPRQVYVVAAPRAVLAPRVRAFQEAKIPLEAIDIPDLAQRNIAALLEDENRGLALLAFDGEGGRLTFTYRGELYVSRHIDVTREALAGGNAELGGLFERVLLDVQRSLDNFDRNYNFISLTKLVVAPVAGAAGFIDYLKANLYQPVETLDLAKAMDLGAVPALVDPLRQAEALSSIGAALRGEGP